MNVDELIEDIQDFYETEDTAEEVETLKKEFVDHNDVNQIELKQEECNKMDDTASFIYDKYGDDIFMRNDEKYPGVDRAGVYTDEELSPIEFSAQERLLFAERARESIKYIQEKYNLLSDDEIGQ